MSYILKALRKAELDRQRELPPSLNDSLLHPPQRPERKPYMLIILVLVNVIVLLLLYLYLRQSGPTPKTDSQSAMISGPLTSGRILADRPMSAKKIGIPEGRVIESLPPSHHEVSSIAQLMVGEGKQNKSQAKSKYSARFSSTVEKWGPTQTVEMGNAPLSSEMAVSSNKNRVAVQRPVPVSGSESLVLAKNHPTRTGRREIAIEIVKQSPKTKAVIPPRFDPTQITVETRQAQGPDEGLQQESSVTGIPWFRELPSSFRKSVPQVNINVYAYSEDTQERFVIVDMTRYGEGEKTPEGLLIKRIGPEALVLSYSGQVFRIRRP